MRATKPRLAGIAVLITAVAYSVYRAWPGADDSDDGAGTTATTPGAH